MNLRKVLAVATAASVIASVHATGSVQTNVDNVPVVTGAGDTTQIAASEKYIAYAQAPAERPNRSNVYVKPRGGKRAKLNPKGTEASLGGFDETLLAYQQFSGNVESGRSQIKIVNLVNGEKRTPKHANS